jgi:hypothetical protein
MNLIGEMKAPELDEIHYANVMRKLIVRMDFTWHGRY